MVNALPLISPAIASKKRGVLVAGSPKVQLPRFDPPPIPRCASSPVPFHYQAHEKEKLELRQQLRDEAYQHLDFHGVGGDVDGLRALLTHRYGGSARGWRIAIAPDKVGNNAATYSEFCIGLRRLGYGGQIVTLWKSMSKGRLAVHLEDLEPDLAEQLDVCARTISEHFENGAFGAWKQLRREHLGRATFEEFANFIATSGADGEGLISQEDAPHVNLRRIFQVIDYHGVGTITKSDLHFLDQWGSRRLGLPRVDAAELEQPEHQSR